MTCAWCGKDLSGCEIIREWPNGEETCWSRSECRDTIPPGWNPTGKPISFVLMDENNEAVDLLNVQEIEKENE